MNETLILHPFSIEMEHITEENTGFCESVFSQGNGYMGVRGFDPLGISRDGHTRSIFLSGCFEYIKSGTTDMVNMPDFFSTHIKNAREQNASLTMDMQTGIWKRIATWQLDNGSSFSVETERVISVAQKHAAALRIRIRALSALEIDLTTGLNDAVANLPISDDQMTKNTQEHRILHPVKTTASQYGGTLLMETSPSARRICETFRVRADHGVFEAGEKAYVHMHAALQAGELLTIEKVISVYTWRDGLDDLESAANELCDILISDGFDGVYQASSIALKMFWNDCDIRLDASDAMQSALRYNILQMLQNDAADDPHANIGARGLMHGRYKGNYFWDTEIFMLPFFLFTRPEAAKNLLLYRWNTLPNAIEGAKNMGLRGARYPWMCSDTGFEQCETWDTGCCEIHITADISYAVCQYLRVTGDEEFFVQQGAEMLLQTARYWQSRLSYDARSDHWNLLFVKGPDEYCGVTSNNAYTNYLVRENLRAAADAGEKLQRIAPKRWAAVCAQQGFSLDELKQYRKTSDRIPILYDESRNLFIEDDLFEKLEPLDITAHKQGDAAYYRTVSYDRLQRYQVCKQADLVLLMTLYPDNFTQEQKENVYCYYEPKTLHDSTLSFGTHAQLAARLGKMKDTEKYLEKSLYLDLRDVMENTAGEGIHMAAFGATWQAVIFGLLGFHLENGKPELNPHLPASVRGVHTKITVLGKQYLLDADPSGAFVKEIKQ